MAPTTRAVGNHPSPFRKTLCFTGGAYPPMPQFYSLTQS